jgi:hypothetical protein
MLHMTWSKKTLSKMHRAATSSFAEFCWDLSSGSASRSERSDSRVGTCLSRHIVFAWDSLLDYAFPQPLQCFGIEKKGAVIQRQDSGRSCRPDHETTRPASRSGSDPISIWEVPRAGRMFSYLMSRLMQFEGFASGQNLNSVCMSVTRPNRNQDVLKRGWGAFCTWHSVEKNMYLGKLCVCCVCLSPVQTPINILVYIQSVDVRSEIWVDLKSVMVHASFFFRRNWRLSPCQVTAERLLCKYYFKHNFRYSTCRKKTCRILVLVLCISAKLLEAVFCLEEPEEHSVWETHCPRRYKAVLRGTSW